MVVLIFLYKALDVAWCRKKDQSAHDGCFVSWLARDETFFKRTLRLYKQDMLVMDCTRQTS